MEWIGGILIATLLATVLWTIAYLYWPQRRMVDEDGEEIKRVFGHRLKAACHLRLKRHRLSDHKELIFITGTDRNYYRHFAWSRHRLERVIGAAIRHPDGMVHAVSEPGRHHHVIRYMSSLKRAGLENTRDQGFVTNHGRYVSRLEGLAVAQLAKQIKHKTPPAYKLFSEDIW
jgi:hypothetical protein